MGERRLWRLGIKKQGPTNKVSVEKYRIPGGVCRAENSTLLFFLEARKKFSGKYVSFFLILVCIETHISAHLQDFLPEVDDNNASIGNTLLSDI